MPRKISCLSSTLKLVLVEIANIHVFYGKQVEDHIQVYCSQFNLSKCDKTENFSQTTYWQFSFRLHISGTPQRIYLYITFRPIPNDRYMKDDSFSYGNSSIETEIRFHGAISNKQPLVQKMVGRRAGNKPLRQPMMIYLTDTFMRQLTYLDE